MLNINFKTLQYIFKEKFMGRKSRAEERIPQILDAFERCIAKYGLDASSIPLIAREANVKHSIIRHYIGNRNDLIAAMVNRFTSHYKSLIVQSMNVEKLFDNTSALITYFFDEFTKNESEYLVFSQLFAAADRDEEIKKSLLKFYKEIESHAVEVICRHQPEQSEKKVESLVYSLISLWLGHTRLFHLGFGSGKINDAANAAELLTNKIRKS